MTMKEATRGTANGKVILFGEHAVVYGVPALAVGIDRGAWAEATASSEATSELYVRGWNITVREEASPEGLPLGRALRDVLAITREAQRAAGRAVVGPVRVEASADLPPGGGLGCSAALGVAVARALDPDAPAEAIAERAAAWERVFHGNPSGIDAAVASLGGCILFERSPERGPRIERVRLPRPLLLCVGQTGMASSTKTMVEGVARLRERRPETTNKTFDAIGVVVRNARLALEAGDERALGQLLDLNQMLLSGLLLSTPEIEELVAKARENGALGAKLTGAGGGGCVVAIVDAEARAEAILEAWQRAGYDGFFTLASSGRSREASTAPLVTEGAA